jgi:hypothetical protein
LLFVGCLRARSANRLLAGLAIDCASPSAELRLFDRLAELPLYNDDLDTPIVNKALRALRHTAINIRSEGKRKRAGGCVRESGRYQRGLAFLAIWLNPV